jgi:hypothetical protein
MREFRTYGSVRGALSDGRPYRDRHEGTKVKNRVCIGSAALSLSGEFLLRRSRGPTHPLAAHTSGPGWARARKGFT